MNTFVVIVEWDWGEEEMYLVKDVPDEAAAVDKLRVCRDIYLENVYDITSWQVDEPDGDGIQYLRSIV